MHTLFHYMVPLYQLLFLLLFSQPSFSTPRVNCGAYSSIVAAQQSPPIVNTKDKATNSELINKLRSLPGGEQEYQLIEKRRSEWLKIIQTRFRPTPLDSLNPVGLLQTQPSTAGNSYGPRTLAITDVEYNELENLYYGKYQPILNAMSTLLQDSIRLYTLLQKFWLETLIEKSTSNVITKIAFENVLQRYERKAGFPNAIDLGNKAYTSEEWWAMLRQGKPFNDLTFTQGNGDRYYHYSLTHRLQWVLAFMQMEADPSYFGLARGEINNVLPPMLSFLGDERLRNRLNWKMRPRADSLWNTFDSFESNGTSPEWLSEAFMHGVAGEWY